MLAHSQGTFCRVVHFGINTTAPAVGLRSVPQKMTKTTARIIWYHLLVSWLHEPEKQKKMPSLVLVHARAAVKILLRYSTGKIKSNPLEPHFQTLATMSRCLEPTKTAVALPHCS